MLWNPLQPRGIQRNPQSEVYAPDAWTDGDLRFRWSPEAGGVLEVMGIPGRPLPYQMSCPSPSEGRRWTALLAGMLRQGRLPPEGVFRASGQLPPPGVMDGRGGVVVGMYKGEGAALKPGEKWITIRGRHVVIDGDGNITKGGRGLGLKSLHPRVAETHRKDADLRGWSAEHGGIATEDGGSIYYHGRRKGDAASWMEDPDHDIHAYTDKLHAHAIKSLSSAEERTRQRREEEAYEAQGIHPEPGVPLSRYRGKKLWLYHGTSDKFVDDIKRNGIRFSGHRSNVGGNAYGPSRKKVAFLTSDSGHNPGGAMQYAVQAAAKHGGSPVVVRVLVDPSEVRFDSDDADIRSGKNQYIAESVDPEAIREIGGDRIPMKKGSGSEEWRTIRGHHILLRDGQPVNPPPWMKAGEHKEAPAAPAHHSHSLAAMGKVRAYLHGDPGASKLLKTPYKALVEGGACKTTGHCYAASEALYHHLGGKEAGWTPQSVQHEGGPHWFLKHRDGTVIDPTHDQFKTPLPVEKATGKGFLTKEPSKRAVAIMKASGLGGGEMSKGRSMITILFKGKRITGPVAFLTNKEDGHVFPVSASDPKAVAAMNTPRHREIVEKIHAETTDPKKKAVHAEHLAALRKLAGDSAGGPASVGAEKASEPVKPQRKPFQPPTEGGAIARVAAVKQALYHGEISADELRSEFAHHLANKDAFRDELSKLKVADLKAMGAGGYYADRMKKNELVDWMVEHTEDAYNPGSSISYNVMDPNGRANAIRNVLAKVTDEHIQERSAERKALVAKRDETRAKIRAALADPKTQEDFDLLGEYNLLDRLTPEQKRRHEDIKAEADRDKRIAAQQKAIADRGTIGQVQAATDITVVAGKHTKTGSDIWTAKLTARVDSDRYAELNSAAKRLGGYYSRFGGGFIFDNESAANKFAGVTSGAVDATDVVQARAEDRVEQTTARLQELASRITERAQETLSADRQTNTARRADMAAGVEGRAREELATAKTLQRIADGVGNGSLRHLSEIKHATQLETLRNAARRAQYAAIRKESEDNGRHYAHVTENLGRPLQVSDIEHAEYPHPYVRHAKQVLAESQGKRGTKAAWARVKAEHQRQQSEDPDSWGMKLGSTSLMNDYETLLGRVPAVGAKNSYNSPHRGYEESAADAKRLQRMGINTPGDLRAALREYVGLHQGVDKPDALKEKMRELVGRKIPGFFPTPAPTAQRMMRVANIQPGMTVLEPSAGTGNLADAARAAGGEVTALEQVSDLRDILNMKGHAVEGQNALEHDREYDRVVMNPPFEDGQDMEHVRHAFEKNLRPGGRLVAIMSEGPFFRGDKKAEAFREWLESHGGTSEKLPEGSFKESGTGVNTRLVTINKMAKGLGAAESRARQIVVMFKGDIASMETLTTGSYSTGPRSGGRRFITEAEVRARARELSVRQRSRAFIQRIHDGTQDPAKKAAHAARLETYGPALAPPPGRQRKEKPFAGSITFQGIPIAIENEKGTYREGVGKDGKPWRIKMNAHYGEIHGWGTLGTDGDKLDAYVGPVADASHAYVVDQLHPDSGAFDEQKVMLGFGSEASAKAAYLAQFDKPGFYGGIHPIPMDVLKAKLRNKGLRGQPISHGRPVVILSKGRAAGSPSGFLTNEDGNVFPVFGNKYRPRDTAKHRAIVQKIHDGTRDPKKKRAHAASLQALAETQPQEQGVVNKAASPYADALEQHQAAARKRGLTWKAYTATDEYAAALPELQRLHKEQRSASPGTANADVAQRREAMQKHGVAVGDRVSFHFGGLLGHMVHGTVQDGGKGPTVKLDDPIHLSKNGRVTPRLEIPWSPSMKKTETRAVPEDARPGASQAPLQPAAKPEMSAKPRESSTWTKAAFTRKMSTHSGDVYEESADGDVRGHFGVHHEDGRHVITHIPSGMKIDTYRKRDDAKGAVDALMQDESLDWSFKDQSGLTRRHTDAWHASRN